MVDNYMKENPNVTIDLQTYGYDDYFTQMTAKVSGGQAPDVFELDYQNFVSYAKKGALMPLDDCLLYTSSPGIVVFQHQVIAQLSLIFEF